MRNSKAKQLRRMAKFEMATDQGTLDRELVVARQRGHDRVVNNPNTTRAMYRALKSADRQVKRG